MKTCFSCKKELRLECRPGRGDECPCCGADIKVCLNCRFFSPGSHNDCGEPQAEMVVDKVKSNYCEYFELGRTEDGEEKKGRLAALEDLFK